MDQLLEWELLDPEFRTPLVLAYYLHHLADLLERSTKIHYQFSQQNLKRHPHLPIRQNKILLHFFNSF